MAASERSTLVAPCGIDCGICEAHLCGNDQKLKTYLISKGFPEEKLPCEGCRNVEGNCPILGNTCKTYTCVQEKNADFCFDCSDFPCAKLSPASDRAETLPHNTKMFNLCTIENKGIDHFIKESAVIKQRYYKGKMAIGQGPLLDM